MTDMISVGRIPLHPGLLDYNDAEGHVVLYVRDEEEGRSVYISIERYGEMSRAYEVRFDDFENVITRMLGEGTLANHNDPFAALLTGASNAG